MRLCISRVVRNWRRACNERGLTGDQCSQLSREFLDYILDELMPWHKDGQYDFSSLDLLSFSIVRVLN